MIFSYRAVRQSTHQSFYIYIYSEYVYISRPIQLILMLVSKRFSFNSFLHLGSALAYQPSNKVTLTLIPWHWSI